MTLPQPRCLRAVSCRALFLIAAALVVAPASGQSGSSSVSPGPADLAAAVAREVADGLAAWGATPHDPSAAERFVVRVGTGPYLFPFLVERFRDATRGELALRHVARLRTVDLDALMDGLARTDRTDSGFVTAAVDVLRARVPSAELAAVVTRAQGHAARSVRRIGLEMAVRTGLGRAGLIRAITSTEPFEASFAIRHLAMGTPDERREILRALQDGRLSERVRGEAIAALLSGPVETLPALVAQVRQQGETLDAVLRVPLSPTQRRAVVSELLAGPPSPVGDRWLANLLGVPPTAPRRDMWARAVTDPSLVPDLRRAASVPVASDPPRTRAAALVPQAGLMMTDPAAMVELAGLARPCHVPYLLANLQVVDYPERGQLAAALHRLGHPEGAGVLERSARHSDARVRAAVMESLRGVEFPGRSRLLRQALVDPDPEVRDQALFSLTAEGRALDVPTAIEVLSWGDPTVADAVFEGVERNPDQQGAWAAVMDALRRDAVVSVDTAAWWLFSRPWPELVQVVVASLEHPLPGVRARATERLGNLGSQAGVGVVVDRLEARIKDADPRVRALAARALGKQRHDLARASLVLMARDPSALVREAAVIGLGLQEPFHVVPVLRGAARDDNPWVRNAARISLLRLGIKDELAGLVGDVDDPVVDARTRAVLDKLVKVPCASRDDYARELGVTPGDTR